MGEYRDERDNLGRCVRIYSDGRKVFVCDYSGSEHLFYLIPVPMLVQSPEGVQSKGRAWIDKQAFKQLFGAAYADHAAIKDAAVLSALRWVVNRFFGLGI